MNRLFFSLQSVLQGNVFPSFLLLSFATLMHIGISWIDGIHTSLSQSTQILYGKTRIVSQDFRKREALYPIASNITPLIEHSELTPKITFLAQLESSRQEYRPVMVFPSPTSKNESSHSGHWMALFPKNQRASLGGFHSQTTKCFCAGWSYHHNTDTRYESFCPTIHHCWAIMTTDNTFFDQVAYISIGDAQWMTDIDGATELITDIDSSQLIPIADQWSKRNDYPLHVHTWKKRSHTPPFAPLPDTINLGLLLFILSCATLTMFNLSHQYATRAA